MAARRNNRPNDHRNRKRNIRRPGFEALESRACPAVLFEFDLGVLRVTGDAGPNVVEVFQPRDRVVEIVGDGQRRTFEGVDEVIVDLGDGDDQATSSKPKEIVVVGSKIKEVIDVGEGNDRVIINDGDPSRRPTISSTPLDVEVNLGTGADELTVQLHHHDQVELDLVADDGGDRILIGMLLPAVQKVREAAARIDLQLGGGGNQVAVSTANFDTVEVSTQTTSPAAGDGIKREIDLLSYSFGFQPDGGPNTPRGNVHLHLSLGAAHDIVNLRAVGDHPDFLWQPLDLTASIDLGAGDDALTVMAQNLGDVQLALDAGDGDDQATVRCVRNRLFVGGLTVVDADLGAGDDVLSLENHGVGNVAVNLDAEGGTDHVRLSIWVYGTELPSASGTPNVVLDVHAGGGNDSIWIDLHAPTPFSFTRDGKATGMAVDLGDGDDRLSIHVAGFTEVTTLLHAGTGNDKVAARFRMFSLVDRTQLALDARLGAGDDRLVLHAIGYDRSSTTIDGGEGNNSISTLFISKMQALRDRVRRAPQG